MSWCRIGGLDLVGVARWDFVTAVTSGDYRQIHCFRVQLAIHYIAACLLSSFSAKSQAFEQLLKSYILYILSVSVHTLSYGHT